MKNNHNKNNFAKDYANFEDFNEEYSIKEIELNENYLTFEEEYSDLIEENDENKEELNHISNNYDDEKAISNHT